MSDKLRVVKPIPITDGMLTSNATETDYAEWSASTAYTLAQRCIRASVHKVYEALIGNREPVIVTLTIAAPCVVTWANHGLPAGTAIKFATTGALPTGLVAGTVYFVLAPTTTTFNVAATVGGAAITTTGTQSGTHDVTALMNYNKTPETDTTNWLEIGATNRWKMFDTVNTTQTEVVSNITTTLVPGQIINSVTLLNVDADTVQVKMTDPVDGVVFDRTVTMLAPPEESNWYSYFFDAIRMKDNVVITDMPAYGSAPVEVKINKATGNAKCGVLIMGRVRTIGEFGVEVGVRVGVQDYSRKERDAFGNYKYVKRSNSKKFSAQMLISNRDLDSVNRYLAELDGPVVWIGSDLYDSLVVYGFAKDYGTTINYAEYSQFTIDVEGLT